MAELELAALATQCLGRRIPDAASLKHETDAWQDDRNRTGVRIHWRFTTTDARSKLARLYPTTLRWRATLMLTQRRPSPRCQCYCFSIHASARNGRA